MRTKLRLIFVILVFIFSASSVLAARIWENSGSESALGTGKNSYNEAINGYRLAREEYLEALNGYKTLQCKEDSQNCQKQEELTVEKAKHYLVKVKDAMAKFLLLIKVKIEGFNINEKEKSKITDEISKDLEWLDSKEIEINNFQSQDQVKEFNQTLRTFWSEEQAKIKKYIGNIFVWKIEAVTSKIEDIIGKIENKINDTDKEGYDVSEAKKILSDVKDKLKTVEEKTNEAKIIFNSLTVDNLSKFDDGKTKIKESAKIIKEVYEELKSLADGLEKSKLKKKEVTGEGQISIKGQGLVSLEGNCEISGSIGNEKSQGTVTITDKDNDIQIETYGQGEKVEMGNGKVQYKNIGQIKIKGSDVIIELSSQFIEIEARGKGTVIMKGDGLYKLKNSPWTDISNTETKVSI